MQLRFTWLLKSDQAFKKRKKEKHSKRAQTAPRPKSGYMFHNCWIYNKHPVFFHPNEPTSLVQFWTQESFVNNILWKRDNFETQPSSFYQQRC